MGYSNLDPTARERRPWNAGRNVGPKRPLKPRDIWAIRFYLDEHRRLRDRALFDLAIDSKLRGCDLVKMKIGDVMSASQIRNRATVRGHLRHPRQSRRFTLTFLPFAALITIIKNCRPFMLVSWSRRGRRASLKLGKAL